MQQPKHPFFQQEYTCYHFNHDYSSSNIGYDRRDRFWICLLTRDFNTRKEEGTSTGSTKVCLPNRDSEEWISLSIAGRRDCMLFQLCKNTWTFPRGKQLCSKYLMLMQSRTTMGMHCGTGIFEGSCPCDIMVTQTGHLHRYNFDHTPSDIRPSSTVEYTKCY